MRTKAHATYDVAKHPRTGQWHMIGHMGGGKYIPCAGPFATKQEANDRIKKQLLIDADARRCVATI